MQTIEQTTTEDKIREAAAVLTQQADRLLRLARSDHKFFALLRAREQIASASCVLVHGLERAERREGEEFAALEEDLRRPFDARKAVSGWLA